MTVAFYLGEMKNNVDYSDPCGANPGIGGTQYLFWALSYALTKVPDAARIIVYATKPEKLPKEVNGVYAESVGAAITDCSSRTVDYLVLRGPYISAADIQCAKEHKVRLISWSHNFENYNSIHRGLCNPVVVKNVCVGMEQRDLLLDTKIYHKTISVYNGIQFRDYDLDYEEKHPYRICYIGNLYPGSGYEYVAKAWPGIKKEIPQAELFVIGGNNLYYKTGLDSFYSKHSRQRLQKIVSRNLMDGDQPGEDVHFAGVLGGREKLKLMAGCAVGIANITDAGETFGLAAIEFEALGVPVVSVRKNGIRETVIDGETGLLSDRQDQIGNAVVKLLKNPDLCRKMSAEGKRFVRAHFDMNQIAVQWNAFLQNVENTAQTEDRTGFYHYDGKQKILRNYRLQRLPGFRWLPPILFYKQLKYYMNRILQKLELQ